MIYRRLLGWIDSDDACEVNEITIRSEHDPSHDGEQDFIISRVASLIETGVTIQSITLKYQEGGLDQVPENCIRDITSFESFLHAVYPEESIETMIIKVSIKESDR